METVKWYIYLSFTFIPSGKKHKDIKNLLNKAPEA